MDHAAELGGANDVAHSNGRCFVRRCCEIRQQMIPRKMRSFFVVVGTPRATDVIRRLSDNHTPSREV